MNYLKALFVIYITCLMQLSAQQWDAPVRGSWIASEPKGLILADDSQAACIVVNPDAVECIQQAARFLAQDLYAITGKQAEIVANQPEQGSFICLALWNDEVTPAGFEDLRGKWEAHRIKTIDNGVWLVGSNARGTAFATYTLSERLGIDPSYNFV